VQQSSVGIMALILRRRLECCPSGVKVSNSGP
jgi:hypothetical protein